MHVHNMRGLDVIVSIDPLLVYLDILLVAITRGCKGGNYAGQSVYRLRAIISS